ncbi:ATP-binding protein [Lysobacter koreensis]|uniref:histidine kinase n=1 Tax=Lysobacter koreensis TaxID=266122 RepID=A0ABW2YP70_9GAMM
MVARSGLRQRIVVGLLGYAVLLTAAVLVHGFVVNEQAEQLVWQSLLGSELDHFIERSEADREYRWTDTETLKLFDGSVPGRLPASLRGLAPGVHDDVDVDGGVRVVLVRDVNGRRLALALDIAELEQRETDLALTVLGSATVVIALLAIAIAWGVGFLVRPLSEMAQRIGSLRPDRAGERIEVAESASAELVVIADALNNYLQRNEHFVERERAFIDSASHELRTPIAVIAGATELALGQPGVPAAARNQLARIQRTARDVEHLISLLLVLAKDPARLASVSEPVALDQLLPEIVEDHRHLTRGKDLALVVDALPPSEIVAPLPIVQAAIGNLLRNAIENSDRGEIRIRLEPGATVVIEDPGHGMTPEEISAIYAQVARGGGDRGGGGIGLDLIARLCEHLAWKLDIVSHAGRGTTTTLELRGRP